MYLSAQTLTFEVDLSSSSSRVWRGGKSNRTDQFQLQMRGETSLATSQNLPAQRTSTVGGDLLTAVDGMELKGGGYGGISDDKKRFLLPDVSPSGFKLGSGKLHKEDEKQGMRALFDPNTGLKTLKGGAEAFNKNKKTFSATKTVNFPELTSPQKSKNIKRALENMTPDQRKTMIKGRLTTMTPAKRREARMEQIKIMGEERLRQASQKGASKRGPRFFGKDEGLTTEAPENPGSFFPHGKDHDVIDLTRDTSVPTETTDSESVSTARSLAIRTPRHGPAELGLVLGQSGK